MKKRSNTSTRTSGTWSRRSWENKSTERRPMLKRSRLKTGLLLGALALAALPVLLWRAKAKDEKTSITILGSDTMVNLAPAWAEQRHAGLGQFEPQDRAGGSQEGQGKHRQRPG